MPSISRPLTIGVALVVVLAALGGLALAQLRSRDMGVVVTEDTSADALSAPAEQSPSPAPPAPSPVQTSPSPTTTPTPSPSAAPTTSPPQPQPEPSATSTIEETASEPAPAVEEAPAPEPEPVAPPPVESHPTTIRIERVGSYAWVYISGSGCYGPNHSVGVSYRDESGKYGGGDGGLAPPDGNWEFKESLGGSATPPGRYTFRASCGEINGGPVVFSYDPQTIDWTG